MFRRLRKRLIFTMVAWFLNCATAWSSLPSVPVDFEQKELLDIISKTSLSEYAIRQRLLNNDFILNELLTILGQDPADTAKQTQYAKQTILRDFGTTNSWLNILLENGYAQDQLVDFINSSNETEPINDNSKVASQTYPISNSLDFDNESESDSDEKSIDDETVNEFNDEYSFPEQEYKHYLNLFKEINPKVFYELKDCEIGAINTCLSRVKSPDKFYIFELDDYKPSLGMPSLMSLCIEEQKLKIFEYSKLYQQAIDRYRARISEEEIIEVLNYIKLLAPNLYDIYMEIDHEGNPLYRSHIIRGPDLACDCSAKDGYPIIMVGKNFMSESDGDKRFGIAHELSHYLLGHVLSSENDEREVKYNFIQELHGRSFAEAGYDLSDIDIISKPKLDQDLKSEFLNFGETFYNSYSREQEFEADRSAALEFGVNPIDGVNWLARMIKEDEKNEIIDMGTFNETHPKNYARIEQLNILNRELPLRRQLSPAAINWHELAAKYNSNPGECTG